MNRYTLICRLRGPAYILLTGVIAMMAEWTSIGWSKSWPLYIVLEGVLQLAQRWALSQGDPPPLGSSYGPPSYGPYTGVPTAGAYTGTAPQPAGTAIVAAPATVTDVPPSTEWRS